MAILTGALYTIDELSQKKQELVSRLVQKWISSGKSSRPRREERRRVLDDHLARCFDLQGECPICGLTTFILSETFADKVRRMDQAARQQFSKFEAWVTAKTPT